MTDPIAAAINAAEQPKLRKMGQVNVTINSTGGQITLGFPVDLSDAEILELVSWFTGTFRNSLAEQRSRLILP